MLKRVSLTALHVLLIAVLLTLPTSTFGADPPPKGDSMPVDIDDVPYEQAMQKLKIPFRNDLPQLFVCGDSISVGYGPALKEALNGKINCVNRRDLRTLFKDDPGIARSMLAYHGDASSVLKVTGAVLEVADYKPRVLLLNFGLHDIVAGTKAKDRGKAKYEKDMTAAIYLAKKHGAVLVWVQTTSKAPGHLDNAAIRDFNAISSRVMSAAKIRVIDLDAFNAQLIDKHGADKVFRPDKVHFTAAACREQGLFIATEVAKELPVNGK